MITINTNSFTYSKNTELKKWYEILLKIWIIEKYWGIIIQVHVYILMKHLLTILSLSLLTNPVIKLFQLDRTWKSEVTCTDRPAYLHAS